MPTVAFTLNGKRIKMSSIASNNEYYLKKDEEIIYKSNSKEDIYREAKIIMLKSWFPYISRKRASELISPDNGDIPEDLLN